jgi:hypothetical protein
MPAAGDGWTAVGICRCGAALHARIIPLMRLASSLVPPSQAAAPARRGDYEAAWAALDARLKAAAPRGTPALSLADVPWPTRALAAAVRRGASSGVAPTAAAMVAAAEGEAARGELRDLILLGAR